MGTNQQSADIPPPCVGVRSASYIIIFNDVFMPQERADVHSLNDTSHIDVKKTFFFVVVVVFAFLSKSPDERVAACLMKDSLC